MVDNLIRQPGTLSRRIPLVTGLCLFVACLVYYGVTATHLPLRAGPDAAAHVDVTRFLYEHHRLAVLPGDEAELKFTPYGTTRALRPPFSYIVSAVVAGIVPDAERDLDRAFRYGSVLLGAGAVLLSFIALQIYLGATGMALLGALVIGLMPQFVFLASYTNDDIGAVFAVTLAVLAMILIRRKGLGVRTAGLLGLACGLIIVNKLTAWLILPFLGVFAIGHLVRCTDRRWRCALIGALAVVVSGGWWIGFNVIHYGPGDPLQFEVTTRMATQHARLARGSAVGFAAHGLDFKDLVVDNYRNFVGESFKSTIGNLDWLRLRVGTLQYDVYLWVTVLAVFGFLWRLVRVTFSPEFRRRAAPGEPGDIVFESLLLGTIALQCFMYVWTNLYNDIQVQGKYLVPVSLPVVVLAASAAVHLSRQFGAWLETSLWPGVTSFELRGSELLTALALAVLVAVHLDALLRYVVPFYFPEPYHLSAGHFRSLDLTEPGAVRRTNDLELSIRRRNWQVTTTGRDPWIALGPGACALFRDANVVVRIRMHSDRVDTAQLFVDGGAGIRASHSYRTRVRKGDNALVFAVGLDRCRAIRLDPLTGPGRVRIEEFAVAPLGINRHNRPL